MRKFFKSGLFSPKLRINKIKNLSSLQQLNSEDGFTLVELIVVVMMIGILSSIAIPQFMTAADKAKQKEATGIVAALIKAATAYQTEYGGLPSNSITTFRICKISKMWSCRCCYYWWSCLQKRYSSSASKYRYFICFFIRSLCSFIPVRYY